MTNEVRLDLSRGGGYELIDTVRYSEDRLGKYSDAVQVVDGPIEQPVRPTCPHSTAARLSRNTRSLARFPGAVFRAYFSQLRLHMWMGR
jgi:hypothetical protein